MLPSIDSAVARWEDDLAKMRGQVESYGIHLFVGDLPKPNTGTFNGAEIGLHTANDPELALFVLAHLFGHSVQWNTVPSYRTLDARVRPGVPAEILEEARQYEREASRYGLALLQECGIVDRDQWISDWCASDWNYLSAFYATGRLSDWRQSRVTGQALLTPLPIPRFTPRPYFYRYAF